MKVKKAGKFTKLVVLALIAYALVSIINLQGQIQEANERQTVIENQIEEANQEKASMEYNIEHATDDDIIAAIAREKLGLTMPGEIVFYDVNN